MRTWLAKDRWRARNAHRDIGPAQHRGPSVDELLDALVVPAGSASAIDLASQALDKASGDYVCSDFFVAMVLADARLDSGDVEHACQVAADAFRGGEGLESARCHGYVDEFKQRLIERNHDRAVREFVARVHSSRLWALRQPYRRSHESAAHNIRSEARHRNTHAVRAMVGVER